MQEVNNKLDTLRIKINKHLEKMQLRQFIEEEDGVGVVEVILILVVLIAAVAIFKDRIMKLVENIFKTIDSSAGKI